MRRVVNQIAGPNLRLRIVQSVDAAFVYGLRTDEAYNSYLSEVRGSVEDQRRWIEAYKERESSGQEYYYIIERKDGPRCGTVRLYDIQGSSFTWGSWVLDYNKPRKAALESALLSFEIGFDSLGCDLAKIDVREQNTHAEAFYRRFGMTETYRSEQKISFVYTRARFESDRAGHHQNLI